MNLNLIQIASLANKATGWLRRRHFATLGAIVLIANVTAVVPVAQAAWPERAITMIVPFPPGGPADSLARAIAQKLQERLGQPVVIDNKPGAGGMLGVELGARAKPDGYTMIMAGSIQHVQGVRCLCESQSGACLCGCITRPFYHRPCLD